MINEMNESKESKAIEDYNKILKMIIEYINEYGSISVSTILDYLGIDYWDPYYKLVGFTEVDLAIDYAMKMFVTHKL